ncbi:MAG: hypothetical protein WEB37_10170 [Bacteroidota bacterium]
MSIRYIEILLLTIGFLFAKCKDQGVDPYGPGSFIPDSQLVVVSLDGGSNNAGLVFLDYQSLAILGSLETGQGVPFTLEYGSDCTKMYSVWETSSNNFALFEIEAASLSVLRSLPVHHAFIVGNTKIPYLLAFYPSGLEILDKSSLTSVWGDPQLGTLSHAALPLSQSSCYFNRSVDASYVGVSRFDLSSFSITRTIPLSDTNRMKSMQPAALAVSPDGKYAFVSAFNWTGGSGYNSLFVVDLDADSVIGEYSTGAFAQLAVSPDSRYVYVTDPAGFFYQMNRTNQVLRYDVETKQIDVFIDLRDLGFQGSVFVSNYAQVSYDGNELFLSVDGDIRRMDGEPIHLLKISITTRNVTATYSLPRDNQGSVTQQIRAISLGCSKNQI